MRAAFDLASFYAAVGALPREHSALRQGLVRGLKDYFESLYGYDRYGGETVLLLPDHMNVPLVYGYAMRRLLHDRRISLTTKLTLARRAIDIIAYGEDRGLPHALASALFVLAQHDLLSDDDLRFALIASAGHPRPFEGLDKGETVFLFRHIIDRSSLPPEERAFWGHSLVARHEGPTTSELIDALLSHPDISREERIELGQAWINFRQPRITVPIPADSASPRSAFIARTLPFWVAHATSWPTAPMVRLGLLWLARLGIDPLPLVERYIAYQGPLAEHYHHAVAQILMEHRNDIGEDRVREMIDNALHGSGTLATRRRFYQLGNDLFGSEYLERATSDPANSVRQWATRQLQQRV